MRHYNKKSLYSYLIIAALILAIGVTVFFGEHNQAKLKKENLKLAEEITESINKEEPKIDEDDSTTSPDNISENDDDTQEEKLVYSTQNINVRYGPGTNYTILGSLTAYQRVPLVEKRSDGWSKILFNGEEAYCTSSFLVEDDI